MAVIVAVIAAATPAVAAGLYAARPPRRFTAAGRRNGMLFNAAARATTLTRTHRHEDATRQRSLPPPVRLFSYATTRRRCRTAGETANAAAVKSKPRYATYHIVVRRSSTRQQYRCCQRLRQHEYTGEDPARTLQEYWKQASTYRRCTLPLWLLVVVAHHASSVSRRNATARQWRYRAAV